MVSRELALLGKTSLFFMRGVLGLRVNARHYGHVLRRIRRRS